jgi:threonine synthase
MRYISTRGGTAPQSFTQAVEMGLAPDGGLFLPERLPDLGGKLEEWAGLPYAELAAAFLGEFAPEISGEEWRELTREAYGGFADEDVAPLVRLDERTWVLELFRAAVAGVAVQAAGGDDGEAVDGVRGDVG